MTTATKGQNCWTCSAPAQRQKDGIGACIRHLLPNREQRRQMANQPHAVAQTQTQTRTRKAPAQSTRHAGHKSAAPRKSELAVAASMVGAQFSTAILKNPAGTYSLVGSVPVSLANTRWTTEQEGIEALLAIGITKFQRADCSWYVPTPALKPAPVMVATEDPAVTIGTCSDVHTLAPSRKGGAFATEGEHPTRHTIYRNSPDVERKPSGYDLKPWNAKRSIHAHNIADTVMPALREWVTEANLKLGYPGIVLEGGYGRNIMLEAKRARSKAS